jgi:hypothetical protein
LNALTTKAVLTATPFAKSARVTKNTRRTNMMTIEEVTRLMGAAFPEQFIFEDKNGEIVICTGEYVA